MTLAHTPCRLPMGHTKIRGGVGKNWENFPIINIDSVVLNSLKK